MTEFKVFTISNRIILLVLTLLQRNNALPTSVVCPSDCICYNEYISNLASWKWVEKDVNVQKDDPLHEDFNPYTEHNEVLDNPTAVKRRQEEKLLETVTCILRQNSAEALTNTFKKLNPLTQVLSLIQAPGSGNITLEKFHMDSLPSLIGLEIQGYSSTSEKTEAGETKTYISSDAFVNLKKLKYLNLDTVGLLQGSVENQVQELTKKALLKYNYTIDENVEENEIHPGQVIIFQPVSNLETNAIVPYSVYTTSKLQPTHLQPKITVAFTDLPVLQHLKISGCNLHDISWDMFYKLDNLKYLFLDENDLLFLPDFVFYATSSLTGLSLSRNRILNLQTVGLAGLLYLQKLDVSHNDIVHLSELSLPPFPHLEVADFRQNPIETIFPNTFEVMNSTKTLFIGSDSTPIQFSPNSFFGLVSLKRLDIINANIPFLEGPIFIGMPELTSLTITGNIPRVSYDAFSEMPKLQKLILKECQIQKISMDTFFGLTSLQELDLSHNKLSYLPPGIFDEQISLREVFLQHNKLRTLPPSIFAKIPAKIIRLEKNPWHCSCEMKYWDSRLINQIKRYHLPDSPKSYCQKHYDKGSTCNEDSQNPAFQVKYVYEKRVSPICKTPEPYSKKSVFEVLRKDLNFCANPLQQNISIILTTNDPIEKSEKLGKATLYTASVSLPIVASIKEMEKQLLFPKKITKPPQQQQFLETNLELMPLNGKNESTPTEGSHITTPVFLVGGPAITYSQAPEYLYNETRTKLTKPAEIPISPTIILPVETTKYLNIEPNKIDIVNREVPLKIRSNKPRQNKRKTPKKVESEIQNGSIQSADPSIYPPISRKALKLMRKRQQMVNNNELST